MASAAKRRTLDAKLRLAAQGLAIAGVVVLLAQAFAIVADAAARWLIGVPVHGLEDVNGLLIIATVASFFPALIMERGNITVELLGRALGRRTSLWLTAFGHLLLLAFMGVLAWQFLAYAGALGAEKSVILELPRQPTAWLAAAFVGLAAAMQVAVTLLHLQLALRGKR